MAVKSKEWKYIYGESIYKGSEGGILGGVTLFKNLNKYLDKKYKGKAQFIATGSPYVGHWAPTIYATDQKAFRKAYILAKSYGFYDTKIKDAVKESKRSEY